MKAERLSKKMRGQLAEDINSGENFEYGVRSSIEDDVSYFGQGEDSQTFDESELASVID